MKFHYLFPVFVIFVSGCINFGGMNLSSEFPYINMGEPEYTQAEAISISAEPIPAEVQSGEKLSIYFDVENAGTVALNDVKVEVTDQCILESDENLEKNLGELEEGGTNSWKWEFTAEDTPVERECTIRYRTYYSSKTEAMYSIAVISRSEYERVTREGWDHPISLRYSKTDSPIDISVSLSREQPIISGSTFYLRVKLTNTGSGLVNGQRIDEGDFTIEYPDNILTLEKCDAFSGRGGLLHNDEDIVFVEKESGTMTCKFKAKDVDILEIEDFKFKINYKYTLDKNIKVTVKPG